MAGQGIALDSAWLISTHINSRGQWPLLYTRGVTADGLEAVQPWADWVFPAAGPFTLAAVGGGMVGRRGALAG